MAARSAESLAAARTLLRRRAPKLRGYEVQAVEKDEITQAVVVLLSTERDPLTPHSGGLTAVLWGGELYALHVGWP